MDACRCLLNMSLTAPTLGVGTASPTFQCPECGHTYPWAQEHAGRTARCACGHVLKVPASLGAPEVHAAVPAGAPASSSEWRSNPFVPPPPPAPSSESESQVPAFLRMQSAPAGSDEALPADVEAELAATGQYGEKDISGPDPRRDVYVPVALLLVGVLLIVADFAYGSSHAGAAVAVGMLWVIVKLVIGMVMMLAGAMIAGKFAGIDYGPLGTALLKLAALCLAPSAVGDLVTTLLGGDMAVNEIGWLVRIILYWALVSYLFRLDTFKTAAVVGAITIVKIVSTVVIGSLMLLAVAPAIDEALDAAAGDGSGITALDGLDAGDDADESEE